MKSQFLHTPRAHAVFVALWWWLLFWAIFLTVWWTHLQWFANHLHDVRHVLLLGLGGPPCSLAIAIWLTTGIYAHKN